MEVTYCTMANFMKLKNKNGCFIIKGYNYKQYYHNNRQHRIDGAASIHMDSDWKFFYLFGEMYSEEDYYKCVNNLPLFYWKNRDMLWE